MNITIQGVRDAGNLEQERVVLKVSASTDAGKYVLVAGNTANDGMVSATVRRSYWLPDKPVKANDLIVLYSKDGKTNEKQNKNGTTSHFFYWGLKSSAWESNDAAAILMRIAEWEYNVVHE